MNDYEYQIPEYISETATFQKLKVGMTKMISEEALLYSPNVHYIYDSYIKALEVHLSGSILKLGDGKRIVIKYPDGWWQAFKERFFSDWMLNRWPVHYVIHDIKAEAIFPEAKKYLNWDDRIGSGYLTLFHDKESASLTP